MRSDIIRLYKTVHTWTGIVAGMALFIAFYAGALTMFKEPLARWLSPAPPHANSIALTEVPALINLSLQARPVVSKEFFLYLQPGAPARATLGWNEADGSSLPDEHSSGIPYVASMRDGEVAITAATPSALPAFIDTLHRVVGLPVDNDAFRIPMGIISGLYTIALISGVIILLPTLVKEFFALRISKNRKRMWLDAHNVIGIICLPFHIVMALSATVFAFHDNIYELQDTLLYHGQLAHKRPPPKAAPTPLQPATMLTPESLLAQVRALAPNFEPITLQYNNVTRPNATVRIWGRDANDIARASRGGFVALNPYSGKVINSQYLPGHQTPMAATLTSFFSLHFGSFGGGALAWLYFLLGLAGAFLFYTGNLLWVESRRKAQRKDMPETVPQKRSTIWMAAATVGVCLGCIGGISLTLCAGKWLNGRVADLAAWHIGVYYVVFFASIGWAVVRGAARASVHLLWFATASTAAIPLTSLIGYVFPVTGSWAHGGMALGVDLTAAVAALCFALMARMTARRICQGAADSVWSERVVAA